MILRRLACFGIAALAFAICASGKAAENWQTVFPRDAGAKQSIYFRARYLDANGVEHRQEVWREGSSQLRRVTDDRIDLIVKKDPDGEYQYQVFDRERHIMVLADRTSLYRAGIFSDWEGLAYALSEPRAQYELTTSDGALERSGLAACVWSMMTIHDTAQPVTRICWSSDWGLPISIQIRHGGEWLTQFEMTELRRFEPSDALFQVDAVGYVEMDTRAGDDLAD